MNKYSKEFENNIDYIVKKVSQRGWSNLQERADDFAILRKKMEYRNEIILSFYEHYFLPERHEFEWTILKDIVNEIITSPPYEFAAASIAGGVIGNAAYDLLKSLCQTVTTKFQKHLLKDYSERVKGFLEIASDAEKIKIFFGKNLRLGLMK